MKNFHLYIYIVTVLLIGTGSGAAAQEPAGGYTADSTRLSRHGDYLMADLTLDLTGLRVTSNRALLLTPTLVNGDRSLPLKAVGIYGRQRRYQYLRRGTEGISGADETVLRARHTPDRLDYHAQVPYEAWMDGAHLELRQELYGCCGHILDEQTSHPLALYREPEEALPPYVPAPAYLQPAAEREKSRALQGQAFIDFRIGRTDIDPDYRSNRTELAKIRATIDSVQADSDIRITALSIKGYASPEGTYASNERLARGRTEALKAHITRLYSLPDGFIATDHEAEDWEGLCAYVEQSDLPHRQEILQLARSDRQPDAREQAIRAAYPAEYNRLLRECYPALRHSDYRVEYVVRSFSDIDEIRRLMLTRPQKLSLNELYLVAQTLEPGSEAFNETFELAVRLFPDDETARLNAANTALVQGRLEQAAIHLQGAGESPQATHARALHALLTGDADRAEALFRQAAAAGVTQAAEALQQKARWPRTGPAAD